MDKDLENMLDILEDLLETAQENISEFYGSGFAPKKLRLLIDTLDEIETSNTEISHKYKDMY